jgi:hypothetical protein
MDDGRTIWISAFVEITKDGGIHGVRGGRVDKKANEKKQGVIKKVSTRFCVGKKRIMYYNNENGENVCIKNLDKESLAKRFCFYVEKLLVGVEIK